jgi:hypothetical protein
MRSQMLALSSDTSGANALKTLELQESLKDAEQDYSDQLIDDAIQGLEDANAKAAEQRER